MADALTFGRVTIGDQVTRFWIVVARGMSPLIQSGVARKSAVVSDNNPNIYYELHVKVKYTSDSAVNLQLWIATIGDQMLPADKDKPRDATVSVDGDDGGSLTLPGAILKDPISAPVPEQQNPTKTLDLELVFVSANRPYGT